MQDGGRREAASRPPQPVTFRYAPSFDRDYQRLPRDRQQRVRHAVDLAIDLFAAGQMPAGLGLKRLRGPVWELRAGLGDRVVFTLAGSIVTFVLVGAHDEIRRYLRHH